MFGDQSLAPEPTAGVPEAGDALNRQLHARATWSLLAMCALLAVIVASFVYDAANRAEPLPRARPMRGLRIRAQEGARCCASQPATYSATSCQPGSPTSQWA